MRRKLKDGWVGIFFMASWHVAQTGFDIPEKGSKLFDSHLVVLPRFNNALHHSENDAFRLKNRRFNGQNAYTIVSLDIRVKE